MEEIIYKGIDVYPYYNEFDGKDYLKITAYLYTYRLSFFKKLPKKKIIYQYKKTVRNSFGKNNDKDYRARLHEEINRELDRVLKVYQNKDRREIKLGKKIRVVLESKKMTIDKTLTR